MAKSPKLKDMPKSLAYDITKIRRLKKKRMNRARDPKNYKQVKLA